MIPTEPNLITQLLQFLVLIWDMEDNKIKLLLQPSQEQRCVFPIATWMPKLLGYCDFAFGLCPEVLAKIFKKRRKKPHDTQNLLLLNSEAV